jgi:single-strand DNA-binding protein
MTEAAVSFAGNLTEDPDVRYTEAGIARAMFRVAVSGRRDQEPSFFTVVMWRDQAEHAAQSLAKGSRVVVVGRLQQRTWTAEDGSARQVVEVLAEELGPSLRGDGDHDQGDEELRSVAASTSNAGERGRAEGAGPAVAKPSAFPVSLLPGGWVNHRCRRSECEEEVREHQRAGVRGGADVRLWKVGTTPQLCPRAGVRGVSAVRSWRVATTSQLYSAGRRG